VLSEDGGERGEVVRCEAPGADQAFTNAIEGH
jgi:hypothetical protein